MQKGRDNYPKEQVVAEEGENKSTKDKSPLDLALASATKLKTEYHLVTSSCNEVVAAIEADDPSWRWANNKDARAAMATTTTT